MMSEVKENNTEVVVSEEGAATASIKKKKKASFFLSWTDCIIIVILFALCVSMHNYVGKVSVSILRGEHYVSEVNTLPAFDNVVLHPNGENYDVMLFGFMKLGTTSVSVVERPSVYLGDGAGILLTGGAGYRVVRDFIEDDSHAAEAGICIGDEITHINGQRVTDDTLSAAVEASASPCEVTILREGQYYTCSVPLNSSGLLGVIVGGDVQQIIGSISFITEDGRFCAIGHNVDGHSLLLPEVVQIEMRLTEDGLGTEFVDVATPDWGKLISCDEWGATGFTEDTWRYGDLVELGFSWEIDTGADAELCLPTCDGDYETKQVNIMNGLNTTASYLLLNDERVMVYKCELTDGTTFANGMSGSAVVQNGRLIGVLMALNADNPKQGYFLPADVYYDHFIGFERKVIA